MYFEVDAFKELFHGCGFGLPDLPPPSRLFGLHLLLVQDVHINKLEGADFPVEHPHPGPHWRLANDIDDVSALQHNASGGLLGKCLVSSKA